MESTASSRSISWCPTSIRSDRPAGRAWSLAVGDRTDRHRRSGAGARRGQEPRRCRRGRRSWRVHGVLDERPTARSLGHRRRLARTAFAHTAAYDAAIVTWFDETDADDRGLPPTLHLALEQARSRGMARTRTTGGPVPCIGVAAVGRRRTDVGPELSHLNIYDADAAGGASTTSGRNRRVIVEDADPGGVPIGDVADAYQRAYECDSWAASAGSSRLTESSTMTPWPTWSGRRSGRPRDRSPAMTTASSTDSSPVAGTPGS